MKKRESCIKEKTFLENIKAYGGGYILILPAIILVFIFSYIPFAGIIIAFKDYNVFDGIIGSRWVGLDNFKLIFTYPNMVRSIWNTLLYGLVITFLTFPFPIILALLFNELRNMKFKRVVQTISYFPHFLSWISVIGMFYAFLALEGPVNQFLGAIIGEGFEPKNILMESKYFLPIIFVSHIWKTIGWSSVIFIAAIVGIDPSLYEAASIDGCNRFKQIIHITLPGIKATIVIVLVMSLGSLLSVNFEQVYGFQNVYIQEATDTIGTVIYRQGIQSGKYSIATALGLMQGFVSMTLVLISNAISKKMSGISIW